MATEKCGRCGFALVESASCPVCGTAAVPSVVAPGLAGHQEVVDYDALRDLLQPTEQLPAPRNGAVSGRQKRTERFSLLEERYGTSVSKKRPQPGQTRLADCSGEQALACNASDAGVRLKVFRYRTDTWLAGLVLRYDVGRQMHRVRYANGELQWQSLDKHKFQIVGRKSVPCTTQTSDESTLLDGVKSANGRSALTMQPVPFGPRCAVSAAGPPELLTAWSVSQAWPQQHATPAQQHATPSGGATTKSLAKPQFGRIRRRRHEAETEGDVAAADVPVRHDRDVSERMRRRARTAAKQLSKPSTGRRRRRCIPRRNDGGGTFLTSFAGDELDENRPPGGGSPFASSSSPFTTRTQGYEQRRRRLQKRERARSMAGGVARARVGGGRHKERTIISASSPGLSGVFLTAVGDCDADQSAKSGSMHRPKSRYSRSRRQRIRGTPPVSSLPSRRAILPSGGARRRSVRSARTSSSARGVGVAVTPKRRTSKRTANERRPLSSAAAIGNCSRAALATKMSKSTRATSVERRTSEGEGPTSTRRSYCKDGVERLPLVAERWRHSGGANPSEVEVKVVARNGSPPPPLSSSLKSRRCGGVRMNTEKTHEPLSRTRKWRSSQGGARKQAPDKSARRRVASISTRRVRRPVDRSGIEAAQLVLAGGALCAGKTTTAGVGLGHSASAPSLAPNANL